MSGLAAATSLTEMAAPVSNGDQYYLAQVDDDWEDVVDTDMAAVPALVELDTETEEPSPLATSDHSLAQAGAEWGRRKKNNGNAARARAAAQNRARVAAQNRARAAAAAKARAARAR